MREGLRSSTLSQSRAKKKMGKSRSVIKPVARRLTRQFNAEKKSVKDPVVTELHIGEVPSSLESEVESESRVAKLDEVLPSHESEVETKSPDTLALVGNGSSGDNLQKNLEEDRIGHQLDSTSSRDGDTASGMLGQETEVENDEIITEQGLSVMKLECEQIVDHDDKSLELSTEGSSQDKRGDDVDMEGLPCSSNVVTMEVTVMDKDCIETGQDFPAGLESSDRSNINAGAVTDTTLVKDRKMRTQVQGDDGFEARTSDPPYESLELGNCSKKLVSGLESSQGTLGGSDNGKKETNKDRKVRGFGKVMMSRIAALGNGVVEDGGLKIRGIVTRKRKQMIDSCEKPVETDDDLINQFSELPSREHECDEEKGMTVSSEKQTETDDDHINQHAEHSARRHECDEGKGMGDYYEKSTVTKDDQINKVSEYPVKKLDCEEGKGMVHHSVKSTEMNDDQNNQFSEYPVNTCECDEGKGMIDYSEKSIEMSDDQINQSAENGPSADNLQKNSEADTLGLQQDCTLSGHEEPGSVMVDQKTKEQHGEIETEQALSTMNPECEQNIAIGDNSLELNEKGSGQEKRGDIGMEMLQCSSYIPNVEVTVFKKGCMESVLDFPSGLESSVVSSLTVGAVIDSTLVDGGEIRTQEQGDNFFEVGTSVLKYEPPELGNRLEKHQSGLERLQCNLGGSNNMNKETKEDVKLKSLGKELWSTLEASGNVVVEDGGQKIGGIVTRKRKIDYSEKLIEMDDDQIILEHPVKKHACDEGNRMIYYSKKSTEMVDDQINQFSENSVEKHECDEGMRMTDYSEKSVRVNDDKINQFTELPVKKHEPDEGKRVIYYSEKSIETDDGQTNQFMHSVKTHECVEGKRMLDYSEKSIGMNDDLVNQFFEHPGKKHVSDEGCVKQDKVCDALILTQNGEDAQDVVGPMEDKINNSRIGGMQLKRGRGRPKIVRQENNGLNSMLQSGKVVSQKGKYMCNMLSQGHKKLKRGCPRLKKFDEEQNYLKSTAQNVDGFDNGVMEIESCEFHRLAEDPKNLELDRKRPMQFDEVNATPNSGLQNEGVTGKSSEIKGGIINSQTNDLLRLRRGRGKRKNYNTDAELDALLRKEEAAQRKAMRMKVRKKEAAQRKGMKMEGVLNCITMGGETGKRGRGRPRKVEQVADAMNVTHQNEDVAGVVAYRNKDQRRNKGCKGSHTRALKDNRGNKKLKGMEVAVHGKVKEEVDPSVYSQEISPNGRGGRLRGLDKEKDVLNVGGESFVSGSKTSGNCKVFDNVTSRREQKQMIRDQIVEMLTSAGWRIEYRPREGREYMDPVYVSPAGRTHWSVTLAYKKFQKQVEDGKIGCGPESPNFFFNPIPEERLSILFRKQHVQRQGKKPAMKMKNAMLNLPVTAVKSGGKSNKTKQNRSIAANQKKNLSSIRKNSQKRKKNALLVRKAGQTPNSSSDGPLSFSGKHSVLSWMIESGIVQLGEGVSYCIRTKKVLEGNITRDGICCCCCEEVMSVSKFEEHADSNLCRTYENLYLENGTSLLQCQINYWNELEHSVRSGFHLIDVDGEDPNDDTCGLCGDGGDLVCCDSCPSTFHQHCLNIEKFPSGEWQCVYCSCKYCGTVNGHVDDAGDADADLKQTHFKSAKFLLTCQLCDQKYHQTCVEEKEVVCIQSEALTFCGKSCEQIFERLQGLFGVKVEVGDGFTCSLIKRTDIPTDSSNPLRLAVVEQTSKLAVALGVMDECFFPIIDPRSRINLIRNTVYSCGSNLKRLNFQGFFNAILEKEDEVIAAATVRIHGEKLAEMPFVGTRIAYRRQGMCRRLLCGIELALCSLNIEKLVIPAVPVVLETWTKVFGFKPFEKCSDEMKRMNVVQFPFTDILQKPLLNPQYTAETTSPVPEKGVPVIDFVSMDQVGDAKTNTVVTVDDYCLCKDLRSGAGTMPRSPVDIFRPVHDETEEGKARTNEDVNCSLSDDVAHQVEKMEASSPLYASDSADVDNDMGGGICGVSDGDSVLTRVNACKKDNLSGEVDSNDRGVEGEFDRHLGQICDTSGDMTNGCHSVGPPKLDTVPDKSSGSTCVRRTKCSSISRCS